MSGVATSQKRRKRRKTRAERNMSRHVIAKPQEQKAKPTKKEASSCNVQAAPSFSYTLRSGKGSTAFLPTNYKMATSGTITQERMTSTYRMLANCKSSDWIKRGPIPETEAVKRKVESDLKRILNIPEQGSNCLDGGDSCQDTHAADQKSLSGSQTFAMEVDGSAPSSQRSNRSQAAAQPPRNGQTSSERGVSQRDATRTTGTSPSVRKPFSGKPASGKPASGKPTPVSKDHLESTTPSPVNAEEYLEPEVKVQEVADKLLKEVKVKFAYLFPNRDIEREICQDLHKLMKQSSCSLSTSRTEQGAAASIPFTDPELCTPVPWISAESVVSSTLSACRPLHTTHTDADLVGPSHAQHDAAYTHHQALLGLGSRDAPSALPQINRWEGGRGGSDCSGHDGGRKIGRNSGRGPVEDRDAGVTDFFPDNIVMQDDQTSEPIIRINMRIQEDGDADDSSGGSSADDDMGGLNVARCDAFLAETREIEAKQLRDRQHKQGFSICNENPPGFRFSSGDGDVATCKRMYPASKSTGWCNPRISNILNIDSWSFNSNNLATSVSARHPQPENSWMDCSNKAHRLPGFSDTSPSTRRAHIATSSSKAGPCADSSGYYLSAASDITRRRHPSTHHKPFSSSFLCPNQPQQFDVDGRSLLKSRTKNEGFFFTRAEGKSGLNALRISHKSDQSSIFSDPQDICSESGQSCIGTVGGFFNNCAHAVNSNSSSNKIGSLSSHSVGDVGVGVSTRRQTSTCLGSRLVQSRHNFQTVLNSACRDSVVGPSFMAVGEPMEDGIFTHLGEHSHLSRPSAFPGPPQQTQRWQHHTNRLDVGHSCPLADMQSQARDFLDDLDGCDQPQRSKLLHPSLFGNLQTSPLSGATSGLLLTSRSNDLPSQAGIFHMNV